MINTGWIPIWQIWHSFSQNIPFPYPLHLSDVVFTKTVCYVDFLFILSFKNWYVYIGLEFKSNPEKESRNTCPRERVIKNTHSNLEKTQFEKYSFPPFLTLKKVTHFQLNNPWTILLNHPYLCKVNFRHISRSLNPAGGIFDPLT